jgi:hypothetical protein
MGGGKAQERGWEFGSCIGSCSGAAQASGHQIEPAARFGSIDCPKFDPSKVWVRTAVNPAAPAALAARWWAANGIWRH